MGEKLEKKRIRELTGEIEKIDIKDLDEKAENIIFDTNFLFITFEFKIDVISEIRRIVTSRSNFYIFEGTILELEKIEARKTKNKRFIPLIGKFLKLYNFKIIKSNSTYVDDEIINNMSKSFIFATNDKALRFKIKDKNGRVLLMRQKSYLEIN